MTPQRLGVDWLKKPGSAVRRPGPTAVRIWLAPLVWLLGIALLSCQQRQVEEADDATAETRAVSGADTVSPASETTLASETEEKAPGGADTTAGEVAEDAAQEAPAAGAEVTPRSAEEQATASGTEQPAAEGQEAAREPAREEIAQAPAEEARPAPPPAAAAPAAPTAPTGSTAPAAPAAPNEDAAPSSATADTPPGAGQQQAQAEQKAPGAQASLQASPEVYNGWKVFAANCERCHGQDALGSSFGPDLRNSVRSAVTNEIFVQTVTNGRPEKGMPGWGPVLSSQQIEEVYAYIMARSSGKLAPGRPTRVGG